MHDMNKKGANNEADNNYHTHGDGAYGVSECI